MSFRKQLEDTINEHGGEYRGNLTKDITHLVAKEPAGKKYEFARQCGMKIVSLEWLEQSVQRGMILEETLFNPMLPAHQRGENAWIRRSASTTSLGKRTREDITGLANRKLRRTASARLDSVGSLWSDIVGVSVKQDASIVPQPWDEPSKETEKERGAERYTPPKPRAAPPTAANDSLFGGRFFVVHGFGDKQTIILHKHLLSHGANLLESVAEFPDTGANFLLVPHQVPQKDVPTLPTSPPSIIVVNEFWIEKCLFGRIYIEPTSSITHSPFPKSPIKGFENITISSTAFEGIELTHVAKIVRFMGATYSEDFTPKSSLLVCAKVLPNSVKRRLAGEWDVMTVNADWLWDCIRRGTCLPFTDYLTQPWPTRRPNDEQRTSASDENAIPTGGKGRKQGIGQEVGQADATIDQHSNRGIEPGSADAFRSTRRDSSSIPRAESIPLREITPNSSPPKAMLSPRIEKTPGQPSKTMEDLAPAISSLLAHHQALRNGETSRDAGPKPRHRRKLLGRARSNMSARSTGAMSHASSIDTLTTDGVGAPLSETFPPQPRNANHSHHSTSVTDSGVSKGKHVYVDPDDDPGGGPVEPPPGTQLGYEDPEVMAWREKVMRKLGGEVDEERSVAKRKAARQQETIKDSVRPGVGIAGRTRAARGGR